MPPHKTAGMKESSGFTLIEIVVSVLMSTLVLLALSTIFVYTLSVSNAAAVERDLQMDMNTLARRIADGRPDPVDNEWGLRGGVTFDIPPADPSQISFTDAGLNVRRFLRVGNTLQYESPLPVLNRTVVYSAPPGAVFNIVFTRITGRLVGINMSVTRVLDGRPLAGSVETTVYLRNA